MRVSRQTMELKDTLAREGAAARLRQIQAEMETLRPFVLDGAVPVVRRRRRKRSGAIPAAKPRKLVRGELTSNVLATLTSSKQSVNDIFGQVKKHLKVKRNGVEQTLIRLAGQGLVKKMHEGKSAFYATA